MIDELCVVFGDILRLACTMSTKYKHAKGGGGGVSLSRHICCLIHWLYSLRPDLRPFLRKCITKSLLTVGSSAGSRADAGAGPCRAHVLPILELLLIILEGIDATYETALKSLSTLLQSVLLPLHCPNEMVEWRTQVPVIQAYHPTLVKCIVVIVKKEHEVSGGESNLLQHSISGLLSRNIWPGIENANNIKEILLLQELDTFLNICSPEDARVVQSAVLARICDSCGRKTEHIRVIQRALLLLKNVHIIKLLLTDDPTIALNAMCELVRTLFRAGEKSWNPSVNRMTSQALLQLQSVDKNLFDRAAGCLLDVAPKSITNNKIDTAPTSSSYVASVQSSSSVSLAPFPAPSPLPPKAPLTALKNLPWYATRMNDGVSKQNPHFSMTVTGVAPWAQERSHTPVPQVSSSYSTDTSIPINPPPLTIKATMTSGSEMLHEYITKCLSPVGNEDEDESKPPAERSWSKAAQAISPTLQPDMRFHDLVFGQDLGSGAFSTVRYGRHICRDRSRTAWPEYAIKIISAKKIAECNYTANVEREMAILHLLSHPGISRLISTFRYKECAYLVLEYATGGDLHTLVMRQGRLSELGVRFVVGEVAAALLSVHELGIVYMDLKPENVLVTASGHVKLTDFGGARPLTSAAHEHVNRSKGLLLQLRNGDWKDVDDSDPTNTVSSQSMQKLDECSADDRY